MTRTTEIDPPFSEDRGSLVGVWFLNRRGSKNDLSFSRYFLEKKTKTKKQHTFLPLSLMFRICMKLF